MGNFIITKEDGTFHLLIEIPSSTRIDYDEKCHKSNFPIRVISNDFGKIIVACDANAIYQQTILTNLQLFDKHSHIDFSYIDKIYAKKINDLLLSCVQCSEKSSYSILIISEGRSYQLFDDGYIKEDDRLISTVPLGIMYNGIYSLEKKHDKDFLAKVFNLFEISYKDTAFPAVYINTKDYKITVLGAKKL